MWGGDVLLDARLLLIVLDDFPETLTAHTLAVHVHEQGRFLRVRDQLGPDALDIILKRLHRAVVQGMIRSFCPLEQRIKPAGRFRSPMSSAISSLTRMPVAYSSSSMA